MELVKKELNYASKFSESTEISSRLRQMIKESGITPILSGNLGVPFSETILQQLKKPSKNVYFILEVSSFQLEKIEHFKPNYAVYTNISPDHLDRHGTMSEYIKMKLRLVKNTSKSD